MKDIREKVRERTIDEKAVPLMERGLEEGVDTAWDRLEKQYPQCGYGQLGICCTLCAMGPCRVDPFGGYPKRGVCGADADVMVARNLLQMLASGAAAHSDHGREVLEVALATARGESQGYRVEDVEKLKILAEEYGIDIEGKGPEGILEELSLAMLEEFGTIKGSIKLAERAPEARKEIWKRLGIYPRSVDREIVEAMHRVHMGVDNDPVNILLHALRTSISDGWGGSMMATEVSDVLFGTPSVKEAYFSLSTLKEDEVNIVLHGHNPVLSEMIVLAAQDKDMIDLARKNGAKGINLVGMCCTGNEVLMRRGIPIAGNALNQEIAVMTGAVEVMVVDYQCIYPAIVDVASCFHTKIVSTSEKAKFKGAMHMEFHPEKAMDVAKEIVKLAVENFPNRRPDRVFIPGEPVKSVVGFSVEAIKKALGGSWKPLLEAIKDGKIKGACGVVGCNNPKIKQDYGHVALTKKLIKNDVLVVLTGCAAIACGKAGLMVPEAALLAGDGLRSVCEALGIPPVLHMGSCVDCSRILVLLAELAKELGVDISDLPAAGAAPEWYSQKAVSIGSYFVASGVFTVLGVPPRIFGSKAVTKLLSEDLDGILGAKFAVEPDPEKAADLIVSHIEGKREALGI